MKNRDYLWCALHMMLDDEEEISRLCPACRAEAEREACPVCGAPCGEVSCGENPSFDWARFEAMGKGEPV